MATEFMAGRQSSSQQGGTLHNRSAQQRGGMTVAPPPTPPYGYAGQSAPGSPVSSSPRTSISVPPILLEATTSKLMVPSRQAFYAVLLVPLALWLMVVLLGTQHSEPIPFGLTKREFEHPLAWFDRHVFRVWGPLLPLGSLLLRLGALGLRPPAPAPSPSGSKPLVRRLQPGVTLPLQALAAYLAVILVRIAVYLGHVALQQSSQLVVVSDHLLLAASVVACFQSELVMCLSDVYKAELLRGMDKSTGARQIAVVVALVGSMFTMVFVYADMYCTARWYHHPAESLAALGAGALMFQAPIGVWLLRNGAGLTPFVSRG